MTAFVCFKSLIAKGFLDRLRREGGGEGKGCLKKRILKTQKSFSPLSLFSLSVSPRPSPFRFKYFGAGRNVGELEPLPLLTVFFYFAAKNPSAQISQSGGAGGFADVGVWVRVWLSDSLLAKTTNNLSRLSRSPEVSIASPAGCFQWSPAGMRVTL